MIISLIIALFFACSNKSKRDQPSPAVDAIENYRESSSKLSTLETSQKESLPLEKKLKTDIKIEPQSASAPTVQQKEIAPEAKETQESTELVSPDQSTDSIVSDFKDVETEEVTKVTLEIQNLHEAFDVLLQQYVNSKGNVNYVAFKKEESKLDAYINQLEQNPPSKSDRLSTMAYWINAYNAYTIKVILDNYPLNSIMDLSGGKIWDKKWIKIDGRTLSLNDIEHNILRRDFSDARIHFAVNCAAASCPPLWNRAWTAENLETALERRTTTFINDNGYNQISESSVSVSKIFDWYKEDFGNLIRYLNQYTELDILPDASIQFNEYDWTLNKQ